MLAALIAALCGGMSLSALADTDSGTGPEAAAQENWAVHGQLTNVTQWHSSFLSPYSGANSLEANGRSEETTDITLALGLRPWKGGEIWLTPEIDQGFGLSNTLGLAGYSSGEAY